jgi:hypothetical protein
MKIYHFVQHLLVGATQTGSMVILQASLSFLKESWQTWIKIVGLAFEETF